jgi:hypothetical protein
MELNGGDPGAFSELIGLPVRDPSGRSLGRVYEARGRWGGDGAIVIEELLIGRRGLLRRLRGPGTGSRGIPWANVVDLDPKRVVVRT